jgi:hypothetical protein
MSRISLEKQNDGGFESLTPEVLMDKSLRTIGLSGLWEFLGGMRKPYISLIELV